MDAATLRRVAMNIFPPAWANLGDPSQFPWHTTTNGGCDADRRHSSQAPAVDFFGMLIKAKDRDAVLDRLAAELGLWATAKAADPPESSREVRCLIMEGAGPGSSTPSHRHPSDWDTEAPGSRPQTLRGAGIG